MTFFNSIRVGFNKFFDFSTRSNRAEYNYWFVFTLISGLILSIIDIFLPLFLNSLFSLIVFIPSISVSIRRLHDINKSGWWIFFPATTVIFFILGFLIALAINSLFIGITILFVGFIPLIIFIYWTALKAGDLESNRFGLPLN